ncbi:hypothetical protein F5Y07DRAFT_399419 [Xylaria sp. FL0933]|nr:hypothetical protein F5Y07DRAFT_399419 [Xylaria sp. FL0933]
MSPALCLMAYIAEGGQMIRGPYDGTEYHHNNNRDSKDDSNGGGGLPWYAILLIVYFSILFLVFWSSLVYYWTREKERRGRDGQPIRNGYVVWKACSTATGIAVWIWLFKMLGWCGSERKPDRRAGVGPYEQIRTRRTPAPVEVFASRPSTSGSALAPSPRTPPPWYGGPANQKQSTTHALYKQSNDMFKSPGLKPNHEGFAQHDSIPMITLSPSPDINHNPSASPSPNPSYAPPPPYISTPPPAALYGQNESKYTGPTY